MSAVRKEDHNDARWARSDRLCNEGGKWFFFTREGTLEGPYIDRVAALMALDNYVKAASSPFLQGSGLSLVDKVDHPF